MAALEMTRRSMALLLPRLAMATAMATALAGVLTLSACDEPPADDDKFAKVTIKDKEFKLELALDDEKRFKGLSDRKEIPKDGGMLFVFKRAEEREFVMRDCPIPIDIIFGTFKKPPAGDPVPDQIGIAEPHIQANHYVRQLTVPFRWHTVEQQGHN